MNNCKIGCMSNITISREKLADAHRLVEEVEEAFNTSIPPISIQISNRADVKAFATVFRSAEHSYQGKRISCSNAKSYAPSTYAAVEIYTLEDNKFPIVLFFKTLQDIEDFAEGYLRAVETVPSPSRRIVEPEPVPQETAFNEEHKAARIAPEKSTRIVRRDSFEVNPFAETFLDTMLTILLVAGWIFAIGLLASCVFIAFKGRMYYYIPVGILLAAAILLSYYFIWAINKVIINMSRSLYNINERLKDME